LELRLLTAAESLAAQVGRERPWVLELLAEQSDPEEQSRTILDLARNPVIRNLEEMTAQQESLFRLDSAAVLTTTGVVVSGDEWRFFELDERATSRAVGGEPTLTERYELDGRPFQRAYAPIVSWNDSSDVLGLAAVALSPDFLVQMQQIQRQALRQSLISSLLLLVLVVSLWRLLRHAQRLEARALQGARAEAMGVLAGGLAHELRNPLGIIRMLGEEVIATEPEGSRAVENVRDILVEVDRLGNLTNRFLSLARAPGAFAGGEPLTPVALAPEVEAVVALVAKGARPDLRLEVGELPEVSVLIEPEALRQVLLNLILNAQEALEDRPGHIVISGTMRKDRVELTVSDNGPGMDGKTLARVFDPFFTTKSSGSGLGLAISRAIVENAGGDLRLSSQPGRGTTAVLSLPLGG
jgi:signal transduction histidine kinase